MRDKLIERYLKTAIILTCVYFIVEVIGGLVSGSLSLLGDAGHMFRDVFSLFLTLSALKIAKRIPSKTKTFGYHRVEILAAFFNGLLLILISGWIFMEAYQRLLNPLRIESKVMFFIAFIGLVVNLYVVFSLRGSQDLNIRTAFLHVFTDALASVAVVLASICIFFTNKTIIDPILGGIIALFILFPAFTIIRDSLNILLEFTPKGIDLDELVESIEKIKGVKGIHDIHLWSLCSNLNIMDAHIFTNVSAMGEVENLKAKIKKKLEKYNIKYSTLEFECKECVKKKIFEGMEH